MSNYIYTHGDLVAKLENLFVQAKTEREKQPSIGFR